MSKLITSFDSIRISGVLLTASGSNLLINGNVISGVGVTQGAATGNPIYNINGATGYELYIYSNNDFISILDPNTNPDIIGYNEIQISGRAPNINEIPTLASELTSKMSSGQFAAGGYSFPSVIASRVQLIHGTSSQINNVLLANAELAVIESGTNRLLRIGNGTTSGGIKINISDVTGTLPIAHGGTNSNTISGARYELEKNKVTTNIRSVSEAFDQVLSGTQAQIGSTGLIIDRVGVWKINIQGVFFFDAARFVNPTYVLLVGTSNSGPYFGSSNYNFAIYPVSGASMVQTFQTNYFTNIPSPEIVTVEAYLAESPIEGALKAQELNLVGEYIGTL